MAESWNGSEWSITPTPNSSTSDDYLQGVSCYGQSNCVAVGYGYPSDVSETLVESWDGNTWSIVSSPSEADDSYLDSVSCTGSMHCQAVGYYQDDSIDSTQTLAESWNGSSWSITSSPSPGNGNGTELFGVSCPKVSSCVAVGFYGHTYRTLVESWNGDTWSVVRSPNPKSLQTELFGVSCQKSNDCVAVGGYYTRGRIGRRRSSSPGTAANGRSRRVPVRKVLTTCAVQSLSWTGCPVAEFNRTV